ncbi:hypothetical protein COCOBI_13-3270 [Coccomyxa sp. Obi]|nr:hypothetical protein COCOBI_13-3270 [Coccomyxa sp. Obi]
MSTRRTLQRRSGRQTKSDAQSGPDVKDQKASSKANTPTKCHAKDRAIEELPAEESHSGCSGRQTNFDAQSSPCGKQQKASSKANTRLNFRAKKPRAFEERPAKVV